MNSNNSIAAPRPQAATGPVTALANFLLFCSKRDGRPVGEENIFETFVFEDKVGEPDLVAARTFAEGMRKRLAGQSSAHRIGITQVNHHVRVRLISRYTAVADWPADAVSPPPANRPVLQRA